MTQTKISEQLFYLSICQATTRLSLGKAIANFYFQQLDWICWGNPSIPLVQADGFGFNTLVTANGTPSQSQLA